MCGCWNRAECHRLVIAKEFEQRYGISSIPLTRLYCKELVEKTPGPDR